MAATKLTGSITCGISGKNCEKRATRKAFVVRTSSKVHISSYIGAICRKGSRSNNVIRNCGLASDQHALEYELDPLNVEERLASTRDRLINGSNNGTIALAGRSSDESPPQSVQTELIMLSLPAIVGQAIEPLAQLMETAYIGRLGSLELASAGVSISIFNIVSKVFNIPLLSVATSFVAEDISRHSTDESNSAQRKQLPSVSTALVLSIGIGLFEAAALYLGSGIFLSMMGISAASPMHIPAKQFLQLRALGCPAVVVSLAIQGIFRGFKDTKTPVYCLGKNWQFGSSILLSRIYVFIPFGSNRCSHFLYLISVHCYLFNDVAS
ncbi:hypothetical protein LguiA_013897 [Lonicera macranthoides]